MMMVLMMLQASSESSIVITFLRAARAGSDQQIVECLDAGVDTNVTNSVSRVQFRLHSYNLYSHPLMQQQVQCKQRTIKLLFGGRLNMKRAQKTRVPVLYGFTGK